MTAIAQVDAVLRAAQLGVSALGDQAARHSSTRRTWSAQVVLAMADPRAESPPESVLRVRIVLADLPRPEPQYEIYDGAHHDERLQIRLVRKRDVHGHKVSWRLVHFDSTDLRDVPTLIRNCTRSWCSLRELDVVAN